MQERSFGQKHLVEETNIYRCKKKVF